MKYEEFLYAAGVKKLFESESTEQVRKAVSSNEKWTKVYTFYVQMRAQGRFLTRCE